MNTADFHPEFSAEEITFISARRYLTMFLSRMEALLRMKGFPDSGSDSETFGSDGLQIREDNQYQLDGQQVQIRLKFSHLGRKHFFSTLLTNDECWRMKIRVRSSVAPEIIIFSGIDADDLETAYLKINTTFLRTIEDVLAGRMVKGRTQFVGIAANPKNFNGRSASPSPHL